MTALTRRHVLAGAAATVAAAALPAVAAAETAKLILDHLEGVDAKDVTGTNYATDPAIARKRQMLQAWVAWLELWAARAIDADPLLLNREYLFEGIYRIRNGDEKLEKRIAYRAARGLPMWPGLESESVAEASDDEKQEAAE